MPIAVRLIVKLALVAAIVTLSVVPGRPQSGDSAFVFWVAATPAPLQKMLHVIAYATLAMLWTWTLESLDSIPRRIVAAFAIAVAIGVVLERYQTSVPGRFGTLTDVILNAGGAMFGVLFATLLDLPPRLRTQG